MYTSLLNDLILGSRDQKLESLQEIFKMLGLEVTEPGFLERFVEDPASSRFHGAFPGGLIQHSATVADTLLDYEDRGICKFGHKRSPIVIGLFHDLCKVGTYTYDGKEYKRQDNGLWEGHATKTLGLISCGLIKGLTLTKEEALCIRYHMGAYEKNDWDKFGKAIAEYPTVLYTHTADMFATHAVGV